MNYILDCLLQLKYYKREQYVNRCLFIEEKIKGERKV